MDSQDQWVIRCVRDWLAAGTCVWFCTIVETAGASPRPVGSLLAVNAQGELAGSLSGGCVEDDLLQRLTDGTLVQAVPRLIDYGLSAEENERLGLPCGGRLRVLVEPLQPLAGVRQQFDTLLQALEARRCMQRRVDLATGMAALEAVAQWQPLQHSAQALSHTFGPQFRLLLVGAGELARVLATMAQMMDYRVLVCDPREERVAQWSLPDVEVIRCMPDDAVRAYAGDARSIVITLTHDPRIDDMALLEALPSAAFYVGALGSARTSAARRARLRELGISEVQLAHLHAPVGLAIGSKRPAEIAVAILAELTALRAGR